MPLLDNHGTLDWVQPRTPRTIYVRGPPVQFMCVGCPGSLDLRSSQECYDYGNVDTSESRGRIGLKFVFLLVIGNNSSASSLLTNWSIVLYLTVLGAIAVGLDGC